MMYTDEMDQWLAEARREETHSEARLRAALFQEQQQEQQQVRVPSSFFGHIRTKGWFLGCVNLTFRLSRPTGRVLTQPRQEFSPALYFQYFQKFEDQETIPSCLRAGAATPEAVRGIQHPIHAVVGFAGIWVE